MGHSPAREKRAQVPPRGQPLAPSSSCLDHKRLGGGHLDRRKGDSLMGGKSWVPRGTQAILPAWTLPPWAFLLLGANSRELLQPAGTGSRTHGSARPCPVHLQGRHFAGRQVPSVRCAQRFTFTFVNLEMLTWDRMLSTASEDFCQGWGAGFHLIKLALFGNVQTSVPDS